MDKLKFLGDGSAFNFDAYNTSAYFIDGKSFYLFDCGESICNRIIKLNLLKDIENIYVFITHTHSDHIGSLEAFIYYNKVYLKKNLKVFYHKSNRLKKLLILTGIDFPFEIYDIPNHLDNFKIDFVSQKHIYGSYGYFFYGKDYSFFYSGDTSQVNVRCIKELKENKIQYVYHEVSDKDAKIHTYIKKLENAFDYDIRKKVYLMHFNNDESKKDCLDKNFNIVEVEK